MQAKDYAAFINSEQLPFSNVLTVLLAAVAVAFIIFITYKVTYSGVMYNRKFNISLVMLTLLTSMVMLVIGSNVALSLGMVGALSIVRFRTAIKDPRDTMYIFWAIVSGICLGTQSYSIVFTTTLFVAIVMFLFSIGSIGQEDRYVLIIRGMREKESEMMRCVFNNFKSSQIRAKNTNESTIELVYQVRLRRNDDKEIIKKLYNIEGVNNVNLVAQNGETIG